MGFQRHLIRRSALRAFSSPSISLLSKSRSISTSSPFLPRPKPQAFVSPIFRRFFSDDLGEAHRSETDTTSSPSTTSSNPSDTTSSFASAAESVSTYASDAAESVASSAAAARDTVSDAFAGRGSGPGVQRTSSRSQGSNRQDERSVEGRGGDYAERRPALRELDLTPTNAIYVGNLLFDLTEEDLAREFAEYGEIKSLRVAKDDRGLSKGFAHVEFESVDAATSAIEAKNLTVLEGRRIVVNFQAKTRRSPAKNPPSNTIFIGNIAFEMSDADLNKLFRDVKNVIDVRVAIDRRTGQPRGFAHAEFVDVESAVQGMEYLQGQKMYGRTLRLDYSTASNSTRVGGYSGGRDRRDQDTGSEGTSSF